MKEEVNNFISEACSRGLEKLLKDTKPLMSLPDSDDVIVTTNRMCEGVFAVYKNLEHHFTSMGTDMIEILTRCSINKVINASILNTLNGLDGLTHVV